MSVFAALFQRVRSYSLSIGQMTYGSFLTLLAVIAATSTASVIAIRHIDSTFDGLQWDLEPDGFGVDIVDNRSIENLSGTEPFKWNGGNPNMATECGPRTEKYFYRSQSYNSAELADLVTYVMALPYRPNRYRLPGGELTTAQERGKSIFERTTRKKWQP